MAAAPPSGMNLAGGLGAFGDALQGVSDIFGGIEEQSGYFAQGSRYRQQAALDLYGGGLEVQKQEKAAVETISEAQAASGAAGVTMAGSPAVAQRESITNANMADAASRFSAKVRNVEDLYEAQVQDWEGKQALMGGIASGVMSFAKAGAALAV